VAAPAGSATGLDPLVRGARVRATVTILLLGVCIVVAVVEAAQLVARLIQLNRLGSSCLASHAPAGCTAVDPAATVDAIKELDDRGYAVTVADIVCVIAAGIPWAIWQHRAHRVLRDHLRAPNLQFTPGWAAGWWFVPFANLGKPAQVNAELWRASGGADGSGVPWTARKLPSFFAWWWALWIGRLIVLLVARAATDTTEPARSLSSVRFNDITLAVSGVVTAVAGILAVLLVRSSQARLESATRYGPTGELGPLWPPWARTATASTTGGDPAPRSDAAPGVGDGPAPAPARRGGLAPQPAPQGGRFPAPAEREPATAGRAPASVGASGHPGGPPDQGTAVPAGPMARRPPPPGRATLAFAVAVIVAALAGSVLVVATTPSIGASREAAARAGASPSVIAPVATTSDWRGYGDQSEGFTIAAPSVWEQRPPRGTKLLLVTPATGSLAAVVGVVTESLPTELALDQYVEGFLHQVRTDPSARVRGEIAVVRLQLPAGPATLIRYHTVNAGSEAVLSYYVLVKGSTAWVVTCLVPAEQEDRFTPQFEQIASTLRLT
jgi:Domain of unknown function (DUF4328)